MTKKKQDINQTTDATQYTVASEANKYGLFESLVKLSAKYSKGTIFFAVLMLFIIMNMVINPINLNRIIEKWTDRTELLHQVSLQKRQAANMAIPSILDNILIRCKADRIMILEYHNSGQNVSGLSFYHFTATYETIDEYNDTIDYVKDQYQNQYTSDYSYAMRETKKYRYFYIADINMLETLPREIKKLKKNDVSCIYMVELTDDNNNSIGVMTISSNTPDKLDENLVDDIVLKYKQQIGHLLTGVAK